jgi:uncharacterized protein (TIGR02246 family)
MRRELLILGTLCCFASFAGADTRAEIEGVAHAMQTIVNKGDGKAVAALYTEDAIVLNDGSEPVKGRAAIAKTFQHDFDTSGFGNIRFKTLEVYDGGSTATEFGEWDWGNNKGVTVDRGTYIVIYKKVSGHWKLFRDMSTSIVAAKK